MKSKNLTNIINFRLYLEEREERFENFLSNKRALRRRMMFEIIDGGKDEHNTRI